MAKNSLVVFTTYMSRRHSSDYMLFLSKSSQHIPGLIERIFPPTPSSRPSSKHLSFHSFYKRNFQRLYMESQYLPKLKAWLVEKPRAPEPDSLQSKRAGQPSSTPIPSHKISWPLPDPLAAPLGKNTLSTEKLVWTHYLLCPKVEVVPKPVLPPKGVPKDLLNIFRMYQVFPLNLERIQLLFKAYLENSFFMYLIVDVSNLIWVLKP